MNYEVIERKLNSMCNKFNELILIKERDAYELLASILDYIFIGEGRVLLTSYHKKNIILNIIKPNIKYEGNDSCCTIPEYMRLVNKDTLSLMCHEIQKYHFDYGNELYVHITFFSNVV